MQEKNSVFHLEIIKHVICYLISFAGLYISVILIQLITQLIPGFKALDDATKNSILNTGAYALTFIALVIYLYNNVLKDILRQYKNIKNVLMGLVYGLGLLFGSMIVGVVFYNIASILGIDLSVNENEQSIRDIALAQPVLTILMSVVFAPITEEIGYRLGIFGGIHKYNRVLAYVVTALVFSLIHTNFTADNFINELFNLPQYIFAGAWLCFTYEKSGSIVTSITAHMTNNAVALLLTFSESELWLIR